jgi:predicted Zn-dependent protease with MMP-like domain
MAYRVSRERFEQLVEQAMESLPGEHIENIRNLSVIVEDLPSRALAKEMDMEQDELLGLFTGAPFGEQEGFFNAPSLPDTILLFQKNIEAICDSEDELIEEIQITVVHEVGHYFGLSEDDLEPYE